LGHTTRITRAGRAALLAAALSATLALAGCGGVEFQGKIFDAVGLSGERKEADVRMAERPPLLLPPDPKALPQPGSGVAVATAREDWPQNPEVTREQVLKAEDDKLAKEESGRQPLHPYIGKPTLLNKLLPNKKKAEEVDDVPEPDPSDTPPAGEDVAQAKPQPLTPHVPQEITPTDEAFKPAAPDSYRDPNALY
jgi:hypothetical protein